MKRIVGIFLGHLTLLARMIGGRFLYTAAFGTDTNVARKQACQKATVHFG
jgi:hypothetical protein